MASQQWQGSTLASNTQTDTLTGLLPQYFTTSNPNFINLAVKSEQPDALGRFGRNRDYQMYSSPYWQRGVWEYTQDAIFSKDAAKVDLALKGLEFAFSKQLSNGNFSFVPVPGTAESSQQDVGLNGQSDLRATAFFMAALGTCLSTYQESQWFQTDAQNQSFRDRLTFLTPKIQRALNFLNLDSNVSTLQKDSNDTNRVWHWALAYYGAGKFLDDPKAQQIGLNFAQKALSQFDPVTGIFLENGGGDSSYQAVNMVVASRFSFLLEKNDPLRTKIQQAVVKGAAWEQSKILSTGEVSTDGNSRIYNGGENFMGKEKVIDKKQVVLGMSYAALFSNNQTYWRSAERVSDFYNLDYTTPGVLSFSAPTFSVNEDGTPISAVTIIRTGGSYGNVSATLSMNNGTATKSDYNKSPIVINFADGDSTPKVIKIPILNDSVRESNESFSMNLSRPQGRVSIGSQRTAVLTIVDNDSSLTGTSPTVAPPIVTIDPVNLSLVEDSSGTTPLTFTVKLSQPFSQTVTVPFTTQNGTAIAGSDFTANSGLLSFTPSQTTQTFTVNVKADALLESDETFIVKLGTPTNASLGSLSQSVVTIADYNGTGRKLIGGSSNSLLLGGDGADTLIGGSGKDTLIGGQGNDIYYAHDISDIIAETSAIITEIDTVRAYISYGLGANVERLSLRGSSNLNATGNSLNNLIAGNSGNNVLNGQTGDDTLIGYAGNDVFANAGGNDTLVGGAGNDRFHYITGNAFSAAAIGVDQITDFSRIAGNTDSLVLSSTTFDAGTNLASVSSDALAATNSAHITFSTATGRLFYNQNGSAAGLGTGAHFATFTSINGAAISETNTLLATDLSVVA